MLFARYSRNFEISMFDKSNTFSRFFVMAHSQDFDASGSLKFNMMRFDSNYPQSGYKVSNMQHKVIIYNTMP